MSMDRLLLTIEEAAHALHLGRSKTYELIQQGQLVTVRIGRAVRIPAEAVRDLIERLASEQNG
jgi:excisionase family DNA binding protein